jgi:hypothetical protein
MALISELSAGWEFYNSFYALDENEHALSLSQAVELLKAVYGG